MSTLIKCDICGTTISETAACFSKWHKITVTTVPLEIYTIDYHFCNECKKKFDQFLKDEEEKQE